ncbi:MAG: TonB-dependent receptor [Xanthomonadaceae bacterium]|jgi:iron complex outermembrane receptor protein|nr:TonB-dependent receptor [Xanthomonadaceae bacterium]
MKLPCSRHILGLAVAAALLPAGAYAAAQPDPQPDPQPEAAADPQDASTLEAVTVTAQRREEELQKTPISITALSKEDLERKQVARLDDLKFEVPNLVIEPNTGTTSGAKIFLRGVGADESLFTADPAVAIYVDDVYIPRQTGAMLDLYDVERIEVLRGPQGTLYGRNATGGAIRYITRQPNGDPSFVVSGQFGNLGRGDLRTALGGRLGEALDFSAAALTRNRDGFSRDVTNNRDVNDQEVYAMRLGFSLPLGDSTRASLALDGIKERSGPAYATGVIRAGGTRPVSDPDNDYYTLQTNVVQGRNDLDQFGAVLTLETELDWATWRNIAHYRGMENLLFGDFDGTAQTRFHLFQDQDQDQKGYESQLISTGDGPFTWVGGVFLFRESNEQPTRQDIFATGSTNTINLDTEARALYGQGTYAFSDALRLTGGLRWSWEEKDFSVVSVRANGTPNFSFAKKDDWSKLDWRLALDYQFNDDVMGYASAATGFKSGGFNGRGASPAAITTVDEETVLAYEVGVKTTLLDDRLRFNAAYYRNQYDDLQLTAFAPDGTSLLLNAADTRIQGFEVDATAVLAPGWQVNASVGTIDAEYTDFSAINRPIFEGKELKQAPELTWTLGTQYALELGDGELVMGVQAHYTDEHFQNLANSPIIKTDEYTLVDARIAYEAAGGKWMVALWGKNLTDEEYFTGAFDLAALGFADAYMNVPRTYGIDFRYRFW